MQLKRLIDLALHDRILLSHILLCNLLCFATFATRLAPGYDKSRHLSFPPRHHTSIAVRRSHCTHGNNDETLYYVLRSIVDYDYLWILDFEMSSGGLGVVTYPSFYIHLGNLYAQNGYISVINKSQTY